jgi:hypothetical protein
MRTSGKLLAVVLLLALPSACARQTPRSIQGVWRAIEQTINGSTLTGEKLGVGYIIYTANHYAVVRETGSPPRLQVDSITTASASDLRAMWGPFVAQIGTYELKGDHLIQHIVVAKMPINMTDGQDGQNPGGSRVRFEKDVLVLEPYDKTVQGRLITLKLVRAE